jgi:hypothetical protein
MEETLISFETAKAAKEKGFYIKYAKVYNKNNKCLITYIPSVHSFNDYIPASTQSLLQKWLREEHNINLYVALSGIAKPHWFYSINDNIIMSGNVLSYEEALEKGLYEALKLI